ncbi:DUF1542 domain-containing protein, partial [Peptostreptococcaceae bacterium OttesenSCG-928-C18]|nr:DUF1542 domain-containing protein [Peptostreptococcaceae bacterium OttesenSCG-928-C18]
MLRKFKRGFSMLLLIAMLLTSMPISALADENDVPTVATEEASTEADVPIEENSETGTETPEEVSESTEDEEEPLSVTTQAEVGEVLVSSWDQFLAAWNSTATNKITLLNDIIRTPVGGFVARTTPIVVDGQGKYKLDVGALALEMGMPTVPGNVLKLQDITLAHYGTTEYINGPDAAKWTIHFLNIKSTPSTVAPADGASMYRLTQMCGADLIFEGNIDITVRAEFAEPGSVLFKEGTVFKGHQENKTLSLPYSGFWYRLPRTADRKFVIEDNVSVSFTRDVYSDYPVVYQMWDSMTVGNNVKWHQENHRRFISNQLDDGGAGKNVIFGKRCKITTINSAMESISFTGAAPNYIEFGPGSSIEIAGRGSVIELGTASRLVFRNPVGLDLSTDGSYANGRVFRIAAGGSVEFQYVTLSTWNVGSNTSGPASAEFPSVINAQLSSSTDALINSVTSDSSNLVSHFRANNSMRITTQKVDVGDVGIQYINQTGDKVGEVRLIDYNKDIFVVDEEVEIPETVRTTEIPAGYHYATPAELTAMGKTQPEYAFTGMQGVAGLDPRIAEVYIHGDNTNIDVNFVNVRNNKVLRTDSFEEVIGAKINIAAGKYIQGLPSTYHVASGSELGVGQTQTSNIVVEKDGSYYVFVAEAAEITNGRDAAIAAVEEAARQKIEAINNVDGALDGDRQAAIDAVNAEKDKAIEALENSNTVAEINTERDKGIDAINAVPLPKSGVELAKDAAKAAVEKAAADRIALVEAVDGVTVSESKAATDAINAYKDQALQAIDDTTTITAVNNERDTGIDNINSVPIPKSTLEKAQDNAKDAIDAAAQKRIDEINAVPGADPTEVAEKIAEVNAEKDKAYTNIDNATTVAQVETAKTDGVKAIEAVELPKSGVEIAKDAAREAVEKAAADKIAEINAVPGATAEAKQAAIDEVNGHKDSALADIDSATTESQVAVAKDTGIDNINNVALPPSGIQLARDEAKAAVEKAAADRIALVEAVDGATYGEVKAAVDAINDYKDQALAEIDDANTVTSINRERDNGIANINSVPIPKSTLEKAQDNAKAAIDAAAQKRIDEINAVPGADPAEVAEKIAEVNAEKDKAYTEIDNATTVAEVETAKNDGVRAIEAVELPKSGLELAKDAAKEAVEKAAADKIADINAVPGATAEDKQKAIDEVNGHKDSALAGIDNATTESQVASEKDTGIENINNVALPPSGLALAKEDAKAAVEKAAADRIAEINAVPGAKPEDKQKAIDEVNKHKDNAITAIDNSSNIAGVTNARDTGIENINNVPLPRDEISLAKDEAIAAINKAAADRVTAINLVSEPIAAEKEAALAKVEEERVKALGNVDLANTVAEVTTARDDGVTAINNVPLPSSGMDRAKDAAKAKVQEAADKKIAEINAVENADPAEVQAAIDEVNRHKNDAFDAIDVAESSYDVLDARDTGINNINNVKVPEGDNSLNLAKEEAIAAVNKAADDRIAKIVRVSEAKEADIEAAIALVENERAKALSNIDKANTVETVIESRDNGIEAINRVPLPESGLDRSKDDAKAAVEKAAADKIAEIRAVPGASVEDIEAAIAEVNNHKDTALKGIDDATSVYEVIDARNDGIAKIEAVPLPKANNDLELSKEEAIAAINKAAADKKTAINAVSEPIESEKLAALDKVELERLRALDNVDQATTVEQVTTARDNGIEIINNVPLPSSGLDRAKDAAKAKVQEAADNKIAEINAVVNPDPIEAQAAIDAVNRYKDNAFDAIDDATSVYEVIDARDTGIGNINKVALPESGLDTAKDAAKDALEKAAQDKIDEINKVPGATPEDKQKAIDEVIAEKDKAIEA